MANTNKISGKNIFLSVNGIIVGCIKQASFEVTTSVIDATSKCSTDANGVLWQENIPNINSWKTTGNGLQPVVNSGGQPTEFSMQQLMAAQFQQQKGYATWEDIDGQFLYGGDVIFTSTKTDSNFDDLVTFDYELTGTGPINTVPVS